MPLPCTHPCPITSRHPCTRMCHGPIHGHANAPSIPPAGAQHSGSGSVATGRRSGSTGSAGVCTTAARATAGSRPRAKGNWSSPARRRPPFRAPSLRSPARCPRWAPLGVRAGRRLGAPWALLTALLPPDCGSTGPGTSIPPPRRGGPAPRPTPTADPGDPVPHLLHQCPLWLFPPAPPQEGVCGPYELSSCCRPPQGEDASSAACPLSLPSLLFPKHPPGGYSVLRAVSAPGSQGRGTPELIPHPSSLTSV